MFVLTYLFMQFHLQSIYFFPSLLQFFRSKSTMLQNILNNLTILPRIRMSLQHLI